MEAPQKSFFDHEKLEVYKEAIAFVAWLSPILESIPRAGDVRDQLDRASTSIALNIAEGNGKYSQKDRAKYFDTSNASALECASALDVLVAKGKLTIDQSLAGKQRLTRIVRMLFGLLKGLADRDYSRAPREHE